MKFDFGMGVIESPFTFEKISKMELTAKVNDHAYLSICGLLEHKDALNTVLRNHAESLVKVVLLSEHIFFVGIPLNIDVEEQNGVFLVRIICVSTSFLLDVVPHSHSYQNVKQNYSEILNKAYEQEKRASVIADIKADIPIEKPIFQYNETIWKFSLRIAQKLNTYIIPEYRSEEPVCLFGKTQLQTVNWTEIEYEMGYNRNNGYFFQCKTQKDYMLGDEIEFNGRRVMIVKKHSILDRGEFINQYMFGNQEDYVADISSPLTPGLRLMGTVVATEDEKVKLHLDIDESQDKDKAYWFEYVPQSGNVMYCMPQIGTKAMLRFCSTLDNDVVVEECKRENGKKCPEMKDYNNRCFTSEFRKRMNMFPQIMSWEDDKNQVLLSDSSGISIKGKSKFRIATQGDLLIRANRKCKIENPRHIYITKPNTHSVIDFSGREINIDSINTSMTTKEKTDNSKPYYSSAIIPAVTIDRTLATKALGFKPKRTGKGTK